MKPISDFRLQIADFEFPLTHLKVRKNWGYVPRPTWKGVLQLPLVKRGERRGCRVLDGSAGIC